MQQRHPADAESACRAVVCFVGAVTSVTEALDHVYSGM